MDCRMLEGFIEVVAQVENQQRKTVLSRYTLGTVPETPTAEVIVQK